LRGRIGLLGHEPLLYREPIGGRGRNLRYQARLFGVERLAGGGAARTHRDGTAGRTSRCATLSRGMVQRLAVCAAPSCTTRRLLLLDEPMANLDPAAVDAVEPLIGRGARRTRVITSHDPAAGLREADLVLGLRGGRAAVAGAAAEISEDDVRALVPMRRTVAALLRKDLLLELRTKETVPAMALFANDHVRRVPLRPEPRLGQRRPRRRGLLGHAAVRSHAGDQPAVRGRARAAASTAFLLAAGRDRTALLVAKALALFGFLSVLELIAGSGLRSAAARTIAVDRAAGPDRDPGVGQRRHCSDRDASLRRWRSRPARAT